MLFVVTGGTIDKEPVFLPDGAFDNDSKVFGETHVPKMLVRAKYLGRSTIRQLLMVDSLDITDNQRQEIASTIESSTENQVVVTHGTDTMPETARFLQRSSGLVEKTIMITGAMLPYSVGENSDALFNLGTAIAYAQCLPSGVYVAMNGTAFSAHNVRKDIEAGVFTRLNNSEF